jgi:NHLM bacteriocin system ABC transporter ATP-binding protein
VTTPDADTAAGPTAPPLAPAALWQERVGGNRAVALDDAGALWLVVRGDADVFAELPDDAPEGGGRRGLFRLGEGAVLFPFAAPAGAIRLVAVAAVDGELARVRRADVEALPAAAEGLCGAADAWLAALSRAVVGEPAGADAATLDPGADVRLGVHARVCARGSGVWAEVSAGALAFAGTAMPAREGGATVVPLAPGAWASAAHNRAARVTGRSTRELQARGSLAADLDAFHALVARVLAAQGRQQRADEAIRLRDRRAERAAMLDESLHHVHAVLDRHPPPLHPGGEPLLAALRVVAEASGITLRPVRDVRVLLAAKDPLGALTRASGIFSRRVELGGTWWQQDLGPLLAFRRDGGPVALLPVSPRRYRLVDAAAGTSAAVTPAVAATLGSTAHVLYRAFPAHAVGVRELVRFGLRGAAKDIGLLATAGIAAALLALLIPVVSGIILDDVIPQAERRQLGQVTLLLIAAAIASALFGFVQSLSVLRARGRLDASTQSAVWDRLLRLPMSFFRDYTAGDLANRAMGINAISATLSMVSLHSVFSGVFSIFSLGLLFWYDWKLALIGLGLVVLATIVSTALYWVQLQYQRPLLTVVGRITGEILQLLTGISKLRVAAAEPRAFATWADLYTEQSRLRVKAQSRANAASVFGSAFHGYATLVILIGIVWLARDMKAGQFLAFVTAFGQFSGGIMGMLGALDSSMAVVPLYERARPILRALPENDFDAADPGELTGLVELADVFFRYDAEGEFVLSGVSLRVEPGEFLAITGPSGAGKSTLLRLLLGFETPERGTVAYDRRTLAGVDLHALRRQLGVVLQDATLMPGSIFDNIVGSASLSEADAWEAARMAGLDEFIRGLPMGMRTFVSEGAVTFSGGQRQRLMIARAIVARPRILLFDEATSALDNQTQAVVRDAIARLNATRIVIAHRLSTVQEADRILVLDRGRIVQEGSYGELIAIPGPFAELARRQIA